VYIITIINKKFGGIYMFTQLKTMMNKPALYEKGTKELWTDEHISKGMLEAHLNPNWDAATRNHETVREISKWIGSVAPSEKYHDLLDLGCGPGIYTEEFYKLGYQVSGIDFSERSINYALCSAQEKNFPITYYHQNFLTLDLKEQFDLVTLIYYDFCTLSTEDRATTLKNIYTALRTGGLLIVEVHTPQHFAGQKEYKDWEYAEKSFFCAEPHLCLNSFYRYDEQNTILHQHIIVTEQNIESVNIWHHTFTKDEFSHDLGIAGFKIKDLYGSIIGAEYHDNGKEMCFIAQKEGDTNDSI
ncbi:MAG: methyltransferase domain-containing protein, partial [Defluviitaleaceae bacterium]|nr:methyltransferase domain-containing protein [Defluviitaleaceae bacterium]